MTKKWEFNSEVAENFDYIADTSIPKYRVIIHKTVKLLECLRQDAKIIDVGCATGNTLEALRKKGFTNLWGVDNSVAMLAETAAKGFKNIIKSDKFPTDEKPFDAIIANWTLHFMKPDDRKQYIKDMYSSLANGGLIIVSEKISGSQTSYLKFKRDNFLTQKEIEEKRESLKGVLITKPIGWYNNLFSPTFFRRVEIINHTYCFVTFVVQK